MILLKTCEVLGNETFPETGNFGFTFITKTQICFFMHTGTYDDDVLFTLSNINLMKPGLTPLMFCPFTDSCCAKFSQRHICFQT